MEGGGDTWRAAWRYARQFLQRYGDARTRAHRDDMAQEVVVRAWQWPDCPREGARLRASIRTIARRHRHRELADARRPGRLVYTSFGLSGVAEPAVADDCASLRIAGRTVSRSWALAQLEVALRSLSLLDRRLLLGFHEGFCCAELAQRFGRTQECVKSRLHRARRRLRAQFEELVRRADDVEDREPREER